MMTVSANRVGCFARTEDGAMTTFGLFLIATILLLGGYAIDVSNVMRERTHLQMVADATGHAALVSREYGTQADAETAALSMSEANMPTGYFGNVLDVTNVTFGVWEPNTRTFTATPGSRSAVEVEVDRNADNGNPTDTFLLKMVGIGAWDLTATATYTTYQPTCFREGFVAKGVVDLQSNNNFSNGFCIHSNQYVSLNSNNRFETGTVVSMPNVSDLDIPNSGFETNLGLETALRPGSYHIRIVERIDEIIDTIDEVGSPYRPDYITSTTTNTTTKATIAASDLRANRINYWNCARGGKGTISNGELIKDVVIVSTCEIKFGAGVKVENSVIVTTNTSAKSFNSAAGFVLGLDDNCAPGGGAQLVTLGGMNFAANLEIYGSQMLAIGDIEFAAKADGVEGAAMVSASTISGTSNMDMAFCGVGMDNNFQAEYFRLVN